MAFMWSYLGIYLGKLEHFGTDRSSEDVHRVQYLIGSLKFRIKLAEDLIQVFTYNIGQDIQATPVSEKNTLNTGPMGTIAQNDRGMERRGGNCTDVACP